VEEVFDPAACADVEINSAFVTISLLKLADDGFLAGGRGRAGRRRSALQQVPAHRTLLGHPADSDISDTDLIGGPGSTGPGSTGPGSFSDSDSDDSDLDNCGCAFWFITDQVIDLVDLVK
jgi:hypothetical protein